MKWAYFGIGRRSKLSFSQKNQVFKPEEGTRVWDLNFQRNRLSSLKSELMHELHRRNKVLNVFFPGSFPSNESLEIPVVRFPVTCARETLINEWCIPMD
jgi:hypothetical protein